MEAKTIPNLIKLGFSEYEAKAYVALLQQHPATGYQVSKLSGVPRSMIYEVLGKLKSRGAAMMLHKFGSTQYAPVPPEELLGKLLRDQGELVGSVIESLNNIDTSSDLEYVWNIEGKKNVLDKALEMILQAESRIYLALLPSTFGELRPSLEKAVSGGVRIVLYSSQELDLPGGRTVISPLSTGDFKLDESLGFILVVDGAEVLISERPVEGTARASWTRSPLFVMIAEHHLRTDPYLPHILTVLGDKAREIIHEDDLELFAHAMERQIKH